MDRYQFLTLGIIVPSDWPVQGIYDEIMEVVQTAIAYYLSGQQVIATIGNVSALVTEEDSISGYFFKRVLEIPDEHAYRIDLILPTSILMFKPNPGESDAEKIPIPLQAANFKFHSLSPKLLQRRLGNSTVKIAVPKLKKILKSMDITGKEKYKCVFESKYRVPEDIQLSKILHLLTVKDDPVIVKTKNSDDEWDVVYFEQIPKPLWRRSKSMTENSSNLDFASFF